MLVKIHVKRMCIRGNLYIWVKTMAKQLNEVWRFFYCHNLQNIEHKMWFVLILPFSKVGGQQMKFECVIKFSVLCNHHLFTANIWAEKGEFWFEAENLLPWRTCEPKRRCSRGYFQGSKEHFHFMFNCVKKSNVCFP